MWFNLAKGMYEYRTGRFDAAVATCRATRTRIKAEGGVDDSLPAAVTALLAMALHRSGDTQGARRLLGELPKLIDEKLLHLSSGELADYWHDWLVARILYREAKSLRAERELALTKRFPAILRGEDKPADNAERMTFAEIAYGSKHFAAAARLWSEAWRATPSWPTTSEPRAATTPPAAACWPLPARGRTRPSSTTTSAAACAGRHSTG